MSWTHERARIASLTRAIRAGERPADDPELEDARRNLRAERLAEHVKKVVDGWPKLTDAQLNDVAALLRIGGGSDAA